MGTHPQEKAFRLSGRLLRCLAAGLVVCGLAALGCEERAPPGPASASSGSASPRAGGLGGQPPADQASAAAPAKPRDAGVLSCSADSAACRQQGRCHRQGSRCVAVAAADCRASQRCRLDGACTLRGDSCVVGAAADCAGSDGCQLHGRCQLRDGECVALTSRDCKQSSHCQSSGECTVSADAGSCVVGSSTDCRAAEECSVFGHCIAREGRCRAGEDEHCRRSRRCYIAGYCYAGDEGECVQRATVEGAAASARPAPTGPAPRTQP